MKINIYYEKNIEFSGKLYLSTKLINLNEVEVNLGFYKPLFFKFLNELDDQRNVLNLYKDLWKNTEVFLIWQTYLDKNIILTTRKII